jgi:ribulose-phosphate 3-epimerase
MRRLVHPDIWRWAAFVAYRYRFLAAYVLIGVLSLAVEIITYRGFERLGVAYPWSAMVGVTSGILFAYWGNIRFTFKVPIGKRRRAFVYFVGISVCSWAAQLMLRRQIHDWHWSYEQARLVISGGAFSTAYLLHRRFSFADYKKVGVAVYANGIEDIKAIRAQIEDFADVIHVDIVDSTYGPQDIEVRTYRLEVVRAYWPRTPVHAHVMSRHPSRYLRDLFPYVDRVYVHLEIHEDLDAVIAAIRAAGREAGIAVELATPLEALKPHLSHLSGVLFLAIARPGSSGQVLQMAALERIAAFNQWPERSHLDVCIDGGVTETNVGLLNAEIVVSGSSVLTSADPRQQIMRLQTSSNYEQT